MELLANVINHIWDGLETYEVPILNMSFKTFLVGQMILFVLVGLLNWFIGKHGETEK